MKHEMKLNPEPFRMIESGMKTIELRLYDEKRRKIKPGDLISFTNNQDGRKITASVVKLHIFKSFAELYENLPLDKCGYKQSEIKHCQS